MSQNTSGAAAQSSSQPANSGPPPKVTPNPIAKDDSAALSENGTAVIQVLANDLAGGAKQLYSLNQTQPEVVSLTGLSQAGATVSFAADGAVLYSANGSSFDSLASGETLVDRFIYTLRVANGTLSTAVVTVTVTGTNDGPVIGAADLTGAVTELVAPVGNLTDSGTIAFSDLDLSDVHTVSAAAVGTTLGSLAVAKDTDTTGTGTGGQLTWSYNVAAAAVEFLAAGQTRVESFAVTLDDQNGGVVTRQVDITLTGTNDVPVVGAADLAGAVAELVAPVGNLTDSGSIAFSDVDLTDVHAVSAAPVGATLGSVSAANAGGQITWTYSVAAAALESMGAGQTLVESFTITLDDQNGGVVTRQMDVTLTGTNDGPVIGAADLAGAVTEAGTPAGNLTDSGTIAFSDVDLTDTHTVSAASVGTNLGGLTVSSAAGQISWNYSVAAAALEFLAAGQTRVESFSITVDDQNGGAATRQVDITLTGTNDAPVIGIADLAGAVTEAGTPVGNLTDSGTIAFGDVDLADTHTASAAATGTTLGGLSAAVAGGQLTWNYSVAAAALESMAAGQTRVESFNVTLDDQHGGLVTRQVDVTLTGTNDAPVAVNDTASTNEDTAITIDVRGNDTDADGNPLSLASLSGATSSQGAAISIVNGNVVYNPTGSATLQALNAGQSATDTFSYVVSDGSVNSTATVTVTVQGAADGPTAVPDTISTSEDNRIYIDVLANDISATGKTITALSGAQSALGASIVIADGKIFYDPQNAATLQALNTGQSAADSFSYTMRDANGVTSTASVTVNVSGFTEGTVINSGISGTMTFNNVTNLNALPLSYTEAGMTAQSLYPPADSPHLHFTNIRGDATVEIRNHSGCCSTPYEFRYYNPDNTDTTFSLTNFQNLAGSGLWTSSKGGSVTVSTVGLANFAGNAAFQDVEWVRWHVAGTEQYVDNVNFTA